MDATCKLGAQGCFSDGKCRYVKDCENKVFTNADRIRAMSNEELAAVIMCPLDIKHSKATCEKGLMDSCVECSLRWLQEPAKEE